MDADDEGTQVLGLTEILRVLRRRWRWWAGSIAVLLVLALSLQQDRRYEASARILIRTVASEDTAQADPNSQVPFFADRQLSNEIQIIESTEVRNRVEVAYHGLLDVTDVTASAALAGSDVVELSVGGPDPHDVADLVNTYATEYIKYRKEDRVNGLVAAGASVQERLDTLDQQRSDLAAPLDQLNAQVASDPGNSSLRAKRDALAADLAPQLSTLDDQRKLYSQQRENLQLTAGLAEVNGAKLLTKAEPPTDPVSPKPVRDALVAIMAGIAIGVALAFAREFLDDSIRTVEDLNRAVGGNVPLLAAIPEAQVSAAIVTETAPVSEAAEAYRSLRTAIRFAGLDRDMKVIQVTSTSAGDGKTTTVTNLATSLAQAGFRVAVVCCDLRRPRVHELFGESLRPGLTDVVLGEATLAEAVRTTRSGVFLLPAGSPPPNPSELLGSGRAERLIATLAEEMDYVIVDTPPVLPVTDAIVASGLVDATLVVVSAKDATRQRLRQTLSALEQANAPVIGLVLTRVPLGNRNSYGYSYGGEVPAVPVEVAGTPGPATR